MPSFPPIGSLGHSAIINAVFNTIPNIPFPAKSFYAVDTQLGSVSFGVSFGVTWYCRMALFFAR
jgi:hypothetical protein